MRAQNAWVRLILPATLLLRLAPLAALAVAESTKLQLSPAVLTSAAALGIGYVAAYAAAWLGWLEPRWLAYTSIADGLLVGLLAAGAGPFRLQALLLALPVAAVGQMSTGVGLAGGALAAALAGLLVGLVAPLHLVSWEVSAAFSTALEVEVSYAGYPALEGPELPPVPIATAALALIFAAGAIALARALREQRLAGQAALQRKAIEAIVDSAVYAASDDEFWRAVLENASALCRGPVYLAEKSADGIRVRRWPRAGEEERFARRADEVLHGLCVPLAAQDNPLAAAVQTGAEQVAREPRAVLAGTEREGTESSAGWRATILAVPIGRNEAGGPALIAALPRLSHEARSGLRAIAEQTALALEARKRHSTQATAARGDEGS